MIGKITHTLFVDLAAVVLPLIFLFALAFPHAALSKGTK
jgi:hypothetical protein